MVVLKTELKEIHKHHAQVRKLCSSGWSVETRKIERGFIVTSLSDDGRCLPLPRGEGSTLVGYTDDTPLHERELPDEDRSRMVSCRDLRGGDTR